MQRLLWQWVWLWACSTPLVALAARPAEKPHLLLIVADDLRADAIRALGHPDVQTPHIDTLVRRGLSFRHCYSSGSTQGAVCICSRAGLMTGRSLFRAPLDLGHLPLLPEVLRLDNYVAIAAGKWHNGKKSLARAFDLGGTLFFGGMGSPYELRVHAFDPTGRYAATGAEPAGRHLSERLADDVILQIETRDTTKRLLIYTAFTAPHDPRVAPAEYHARYAAESLALPANFMAAHPFDNGEMNVRDELLTPHPRTPERIRSELADYYAMISHMDTQIGRMLAALKQAGILDDTLIVFTADNGLALGSHGLLGKQNLYEHSLRVPLIVAGPSVPAGATTDAMCHLYDLFPTLVDWIGSMPPDSVDGVSLANVWSGDSSKGRDEIFAAYRNVQRSVFDGRHKLIRYPLQGRSQLFDLAADPHELRDLFNSDDHAAILLSLQHRLVRCQYMYGDPLVVQQ